MINKLLDGQNINHLLDKNLANFAKKNNESSGRKFPETVDPCRTPFQRDRDRIIHTTAFRRLAGKLQVLPREIGGDHFRNRLTHTLEVAQIARDFSRNFGLNEDLAEAIALAHDLGHPPFGHAGENALNKKMQEHNLNFDHNEQSLRIVEKYQRRYPDFLGLNLTIEVLEGIQKHTTFFDRPELKQSIFTPHLESQVVDIADEIAYLSADLEDGIRGDFFTMKDTTSVQICREILQNISNDEKNYRSTFIRYVMRKLFRELETSTRENLANFSIKTLSDVQKTQKRIISFSSKFQPQFKELKDFLFKNFYLAPEVKKYTVNGEKIICEIFDYLYQHPEKINPKYKKTDKNIFNNICDYIAGMTDNYAEEFYTQICIDKK